MYAVLTLTAKRALTKTISHARWRATPPFLKSSTGKRASGSIRGARLLTRSQPRLQRRAIFTRGFIRACRTADFSGLRIGDYMDVPVAAGSNVPAQTVRYLLAAVDPYYQCSDAAMPHHLAFVPAAPVLVSGSKATNTSYIMWNTTATNNGNATVKEPYLASHLHGWEINDYLPALPAALRNVLINHRSLCEQRYGSSALTEASGWGWADLGKVWSLSEMEVYGCAVWGSKGYSVGMDCHFPLFDSTASRIMGDARRLVAAFRHGRFGFLACATSAATAMPASNSATYGWCSPASVLPHRLTSRCMTLCPRPPCAGALERQANEYRTGTLPGFKQLRVFHHRNEGAQGDNGACDFGGNAEVIPLRSGRADGRDGQKPCEQPCDGKRVLPQHRTQR